MLRRFDKINTLNVQQQFLNLLLLSFRVGRGRCPRPGTGRDPDRFCSGRGDGAGTEFDPGSGIGDGEKRNPRLPELLEFHVIQTNYLMKNFI